MNKEIEKTIIKENERVLFDGMPEYTVEVFPAKNLIKFVFCGGMKDANDSPNYLNHTQEAVNLLQEGFSALSVVSTKGNPAFNWTTPFKESLRIMREKKLKKAAVVMDSMIHKMILNVLSKLTDLKIKICKTEAEAEAWLDEQD